MKNTKKAPKGYKPETLKKIVAALNYLINLYLDMLNSGFNVGIVISAGNRKLGRCMNVSLAPIVTCGNCRECCFFCYDIKACLQYETVRNARAKNTALFRFSRDEFFNQLWDKMSRRKANKCLRFHLSGEIMDIDHFERMIETARRFPEFKIWTYTKMYHIVNAWISQNGGTKDAIPSNFSVMFSEWKGVPVINPYNLPVFRCINPEEEAWPENLMHCPGNFDICKTNNIGCVAGQSAGVNLH